MSKELTYPVNRKLSHDGEQYGPGDTVDMTAKQAKPLLKLGVISDSSEDSGDDTLKGGGSNGPSKPEGDDLIQAIMCVIEELDHTKDFTKGGNPKVASVEALLGYDVSAAEVANAWDVYPEGEE